MTPALLIILGFAVAAAVTFETERVKRLWNFTIMLVTGAVVLQPLQQLLAGVVGPTSRFLAAQLAHGENVPAPTAQGSAAGAVAALNYRFHLGRVIFAVVGTAATIVFVLFELQFSRMTLPAIGITEPESMSTGGLVWLSAGALMATMIVWGIVFLEAFGYTTFMPEVSVALNRILKPLSIAALSLGLAITSLMGVWRASERMAMGETSVVLSVPDGIPEDGAKVEEGEGVAEIDLSSLSAPPTRFDAFTRRFVGGGLPGLVLLTSFISFTGALLLAKYIIVGVGAIVLAPFAVLLVFALPFLDRLVTASLNGGLEAIDALGALGRRILLPILGPLGDLAEASHIRLRQRLEQWVGTPLSSGVVDEHPGTAPIQPVRPEGSAPSVQVPPPVGAQASEVDQAATPDEGAQGQSNLNWGY